MHRPNDTHALTKVVHKYNVHILHEVATNLIENKLETKLKNQIGVMLHNLPI